MVAIITVLHDGLQNHRPVPGSQVNGIIIDAGLTATDARDIVIALSGLYISALEQLVDLKGEGDVAEIIQQIGIKVHDGLSKEE